MSRRRQGEPIVIGGETFVLTRGQAREVERLARSDAAWCTPWASLDADQQDVRRRALARVEASRRAPEDEHAHPPTAADQRAAREETGE